MNKSISWRFHIVAGLEQVSSQRMKRRADLDEYFQSGELSTRLENRYEIVMANDVFSFSVIRTNIQTSALTEDQTDSC